MCSQIVVAPPKEVRLKRAQRVVEVLWPDGSLDRFSGLTLRKSCACSGCTRARLAGALTLIDAEVGIERLELAGVSGLQFHFSDGHHRGLYPWAYLRELGEQCS